MSSSFTLVTAEPTSSTLADAFVAEAVGAPFVFALVAAPFHDLRTARAGVVNLDQHLARDSASGSRCRRFPAACRWRQGGRRVSWSVSITL